MGALDREECSALVDGIHRLGDLVRVEKSLRGRMRVDVVVRCKPSHVVASFLEGQRRSFRVRPSNGPRAAGGRGRREKRHGGLVVVALMLTVLIEKATSDIVAHFARC